MGHIPRAVVSSVASVMDAGLLFLEGVIPRGANNKFKIPLSLLMFAKAGHEDDVTARLRMGNVHPTGDYRAESVYLVRVTSSVLGFLAYIQKGSCIWYCKHEAALNSNSYAFISDLHACAAVSGWQPEQPRTWADAAFPVFAEQRWGQPPAPPPGAPPQAPFPLLFTSIFCLGHFFHVLLLLSYRTTLSRLLLGSLAALWCLGLLSFHIFRILPTTYTSRIATLSSNRGSVTGRASPPACNPSVK